VCVDLGQALLAEGLDLFDSGLAMRLHLLAHFL
jgi:hypothetical protein